MNATLSTWSDELLTEPTKLIVGLDINQSLRLVVAEADSGPEPVILERHCFRSLGAILESGVWQGKKGSVPYWY